MEKNYKLGIIGCGNMADAILGGAIDAKVIEPKDVIVYDMSAEQSKKFHNKYGVQVAISNNEVAKNSIYTLLAVKPQNFETVAGELSEVTCLISIMAGVKLNKIFSMIPDLKKAVRIMPNAPARVKKGMSALAYQGVEIEDKNFVESIFSSIGKTVIVEEDKLDAVTAISGSGPAYVYYFIKSMIDAGVNLGLTQEDSATLTYQTFEGAVKMAQSVDTGLDKLIDMVCSKGGTTIEAINHFKDTSLDDIIEKAIQKCYNRSKELSGE